MNRADFSTGHRPTLRRRVQQGVTVLALAACGAAMAQTDASVEALYQAARAGRLADAQQMMAPVLRDHPGSAKAHFVAAELLARQGLLLRARAELGTAERLAPGLPFVQPEAVQGLHRELGWMAPTKAASDRSTRFQSPQDTRHWGIALAVLGGALLAWLLARLGRPQSTPTLVPAGYGASRPTTQISEDSAGAGMREREMRERGSAQNKVSTATSNR